MGGPLCHPKAAPCFLKVEHMAHLRQGVGNEIERFEGGAADLIDRSGPGHYPATRSQLDGIESKDHATTLTWAHFQLSKNLSITH